jgi:hypothetical protein
MKTTITNFFNDVEFELNIPILVFEYMGEFFKVLPSESIDLNSYAKENLLSNTKYKIFNNITELSTTTKEKLQIIFKNPDGIV